MWVVLSVQTMVLGSFAERCGLCDLDPVAERCSLDLLISLAVVLWEMSARGWLVGVALWLCSVLLLDWRLAWWSCCLMMSE